MTFLPKISRQQCQLVMAAVLLSVAITSQAQTTYRWVDQSGKVHYSDQPPPPAEAKDLRKKGLKPGSVIETSGPSYDLQQAMRKFPLTLHTSINCVEHCKTAREFLARRGVPFSEKVMKTQEDVVEFKKATGSEELIVPVLQAGNKQEKGFEENAWRNLLDAAAYPPASSNPPVKPAEK